mmetsp:Transcript_67033/g.145730  ORF Transcript_67033/g.145730 Transcript_67033/m.145730 type:complete len:243 (-) Transcript_67033:128-856(-)
MCSPSESGRGPVPATPECPGTELPIFQAIQNRPLERSQSRWLVLTMPSAAASKHRRRVLLMCQRLNSKLKLQLQLVLMLLQHQKKDGTGFASHLASSLSQACQNWGYGEWRKPISSAAGLWNRPDLFDSWDLLKPLLPLPLMQVPAVLQASMLLQMRPLVEETLVEDVANQPTLESRWQRLRWKRHQQQSMMSGLWLCQTELATLALALVLAPFHFHAAAAAAASTTAAREAAASKAIDSRC